MSTPKENNWKKTGIFSSEEVEKFAQETNNSKAFAEILLQRNIRKADQIHTFLNPELNQFLDPFGLKDMDKVIDRLISAKANNEKVLV